MVRIDDALELLLPQADAALVRRARDTVQFLRLLRDDARAEPACRVGLNLERARGVLEEGELRLLRSAVQELLRRHLEQGCGVDSFAWMGPARMELQEAWALLAEAQSELSWLPTVPEPGESAASVCQRLLLAAEHLGGSATEWELWHARLLRLERGPRVAEETFRGGFERCARDPAGAGRDAALWLAGWCECLLDRGAVREARTLLLEPRERSSPDGRLRQLLGWCKLLLGDHARARSLLAPARLPDAALPGALHAWRARHGEWAALLPQRFVERDARAAAALESWASERSAIGASVALCFELDRSDRPVLRHADLAAALRPRLDRWLEEHLLNLAEPGSEVQELVLAHRVVLRERGARVEPSSVLGGEETRALALVPCSAPGEAFERWVHLEFEHHLVPREGRLVAWAKEHWGRVGRASATEGHPREEGAEAVADVFRALVERLGLSSAQRRWWGFTVRQGRALLAASGGDAPALQGKPGGASAALRRALLACGCAGFDAPDPALSVHERAQSGIVLALGCQGRPAGILALESTRRADFGPFDPVRSEAQLQRAALQLRVNLFRAEHRRAHGWDVWIDVERPGFQAFAERLLRAARSESPVLLAGPRGCGKTVFARWLHFESEHASGPLRLVSASDLAGDEAWEACLRAARGGSLLVEAIECLDVAAQERLTRWLELSDSGATGAASPRLIATAGLPAPAPDRGGACAQRLERVRFVLPPLRERREELPGIVACLVERFARQLHRRAPAFEDDALGLLWRQGWDGNLRELEATVYRLVLFDCGPRISARAVEECARSFGRPLVRRLPSRHPARSDLIAALNSTLLGTGRVNKTRAAAYLGWDPDTLVARLHDLRIDPAAVPASEAWSIPLEVRPEEGTEAANADDGGPAS